MAAIRSFPGRLKPERFLFVFKDVIEMTTVPASATASLS
jgi:hypothetical protein